MDRNELARLANEAGRESRNAGAPHLTAESPRATLIAWLTWNDGNGVFADPSVWCEPVGGMIEPGWYVDDDREGRRYFDHDESAARKYAADITTPVEDLWETLASMLEDA